jgi:hypothetical protein
MDCFKKKRALNSEKSTVLIIAITGNAKNYTIEDFKKKGIDEIIPKPINFDNLLLTVITVPLKSKKVL